MISFETPCITGTLLKRYKRFFMDVRMPNGDVVVAHTPNTGSMLGLLSEGNPVMLSEISDPSRKTRFTVQGIECDGTWVGVNTSLPNHLVKNSLGTDFFAQYQGYQTIESEKKYGQNNRSRIDLLLSDHRQNDPNLYLEVKNVTLKRDDRALFPDSVSVRAQKHIDDLLWAMEAGHRAALIFIVQRLDCVAFSLATEIDPRYAMLLCDARQKGLEIRALSSLIDFEGIRIVKEIPCDF